MLSWSTQEAWLILEVVEFTDIFVVTLADDEEEVVLETWLVVVDKEEVVFEIIVEDNVVVRLFDETKDVVDIGKLVLVTVKVDDDREVDTVVTDGTVEVFANVVVIFDVLRLVVVI